MLIQILAFIALRYNRRSDREHVHVFIGKEITKKLILWLQLKATRNSNRNLFIALSFIFKGAIICTSPYFEFFSFAKFCSLRNSGLQVTGIQQKRCRVFLEVITSTLIILSHNYFEPRQFPGLSATGFSRMSFSDWTRATMTDLYSFGCIPKHQIRYK